MKSATRTDGVLFQAKENYTPWTEDLWEPQFQGKTAEFAAVSNGMFTRLWVLERGDTPKEDKVLGATTMFSKVIWKSMMRQEGLFFPAQIGGVHLVTYEDVWEKLWVWKETWDEAMETKVRACERAQLETHYAEFGYLIEAAENLAN
tara:strand:+ start:656 stop:1096 length:441 start_codon:yes stop_codon:yes gene_type:complete